MANPISQVLEKDTVAEVRALAAKALGQVKANDRSQIVLLLTTAIAKDLSSQVKCAALEAIGKMRIVNPHVYKALRTALKHPDYYVQKAAVECLEKWGKDTIPLLPEFMELFTRNTTHSSSIVKILGSIGQEAVPHLLPILKHKNADVREYAIVALGEVGGKAKAAVSHLIEIALDQSRLGYRRYALDALRKIGIEAHEAVPGLTSILQREEEKYILQAAAQAFLAINKEKAIQVLMQSLKSPRPDTIYMAIWALGEAGPDAKTAIPNLIKKLETEEYTQNVLRALTEMGPCAAEAIPAIVKALKARKIAPHSISPLLIKIGVESLPTVIELLKEDDASSRNLGLEVISKLILEIKLQPPMLDTIKQAVTKVMNQEGTDFVMAKRILIQLEKK
jgi:HEAT repeat protein